MVLWYFMQYTWDFVNQKSVELQKNMSPDDKVAFPFDNVLKLTQEELYQYFRNCQIGIILNVFKEKDNPEESRKNLWR